MVEMTWCRDGLRKRNAQRRSRGVHSKVRSALGKGGLDGCGASAQSRPGILVKRRIFCTRQIFSTVALSFLNTTLRVLRYCCLCSRLPW